jgi:hypothetical protein
MSWRLLLILWCALGSDLLVSRAGAQLADTVPVFEIIAYGCAAAPRDRRLTGFVVNGVSGIVTALHGVVGCRVVNARGRTRGFSRVEVEGVDVTHDVAVLRSAEVQNALNSGSIRPQRRGPVPAALSDVVALGYPIALARPHVRDLKIEQREKRIQDLLPQGDPIYNMLSRRRSPTPTTGIVSLNGFLQPGHSGAPIMDSAGRVFAIANGGIRGEGIGWAIPIDSIRIAPTSQARAVLGSLAAAGDIQQLFSVGTIGLRPVGIRPSISVSGLWAAEGTDWNIRFNLPTGVGRHRFTGVMTTGMLVRRVEQTLETFPSLGPSTVDSTQHHGYLGAAIEYRPRPYPNQFWDPYVRTGIAQVFAEGINPRADAAIGLDMFISGAVRAFFEGTAIGTRLPRNSYVFSRFGAPTVKMSHEFVPTYGAVLGFGVAVGGIQ